MQRDSHRRSYVFLIDFANTVYRAVHVHKHLFFAGKPTGGLFGFVQQLCAHVTYLESIKYVLVCDDSPPYLRAKAFPQYKANRKRSTDPEVLAAMLAAQTQVREFLQEANLPLWKVKGFEADDLIAEAIKCLCSSCASDVCAVVRSSDSDLYQLFKYTVPVWLATKGPGEYYTRKDYLTDYMGVSASEWARVVGLAGSHNGVPGVRGIGVKRAVMAIKQGKFDELVRSHPEVGEYVRLARLPYKTVPDAPPWRNGKAFQRRRAERHLAAHGIRLSPQIKTAFSILEGLDFDEERTWPR